MPTLPKFEDTEELPEFEASAPLEQEALPAFEETQELPNFEQTVDTTTDKPSVLETGARGLAQGALFEFADEGEAGVRAALGQDYDTELKRIRGEYKKAEEAHPAVSLGANLAGGIGTAFIPGVGAIGNVARGANLARVATAGAVQGGLTGLGRTEETEALPMLGDVAKEAAAGAVLGSALHGAVSHGGKILSNLKDMFTDKAGKAPDIDLLKMADEAYAPLAEGDRAFAEKLHSGSFPSDPGELERVKEFAHYLNNPSTTNPEASKLAPEDALDILNQRRAQMSPEEFEKTYKSYRELQAFKAVATDIMEKEPGIVEDFRHGLNSVIDGMHVARSIDDRAGTSLTEVLLDGTEKINRYQADLARWIKVKQDLSDLPEESAKQVYDALDKGGAVPPELQKITAEWKEFFSKAADYVRDELHVPIQKRENYVPKKMINMPEAIVRVKDKIAELGGTENILRNLGKKQNSEIERAVTYFNGGQSLSSEPKAFAKKLQEMVQPGSDAFLKEKVASALFKRENLLPEFLQETDLRRLSNSWLMESLRYGHMRPTLDELGRQRDMLKVAGAEKDVVWLDNLVNDYLGGARGLAKVTRNGTAYLQVKALEAARAAKPGTLSHKIYKMAADTPDALQNMVLNVYPNFLGMSPRAMVQNIAGGFYTMMPELGLTYGAQRGTDAYARAIKNIASDRKGYFKSMEQAGFIAPQWTTDLKEALKHGKPGKVSQALDKTSDFAMKGFEASEKLNRAVAWETGKLLAQDLLAGGESAAAKSAKNFIETMPPSLKKKVNQLVASGDAISTEKLISKYFADRTLFSYNRLTQSELARAVGPLFSMFTKFPTSVAGGIASSIRERGAAAGGGHVARKLIAPYLAGSLLNGLVFDEASPTQEYMFGKQPAGKNLGTGIASASPVGALSSIAGGRVFTPPVVGAVKELAGSILEGDEERLKRWATGTTQAFAPGGAAAYYRFIKQHAELAGILDKEDK